MLLLRGCSFLHNEELLTLQVHFVHCNNRKVLKSNPVPQQMPQEIYHFRTFAIVWKESSSKKPWAIFTKHINTKSRSRKKPEKFSTQSSACLPYTGFTAGNKENVFQNLGLKCWTLNVPGNASSGTAQKSWALEISPCWQSPVKRELIHFRLPCGNEITTGNRIFPYQVKCVPYYCNQWRWADFWFAPSFS